MREARLLGDQIDRQVGLAEQAFHFAKTTAQNLIFRRALKRRLHAAIERAARSAQFRGQFVDVESADGALADERNRAGHESVADDEFPGGTAHHDAERGDEDWLCPSDFAAHHPVEQFSGGETHGMAVEADAREGRGRKAAKRFFILRADDRDFFRHRDTGGLAGLEQTDAELIRSGEDTDGFGQLGDPCHQAGLALFPVRHAFGIIFGEFPAALTVGGDDLLEFIDPFDEEAFAALTVSGEVPVTPLVKVFGYPAADIIIITADEGTFPGEMRGAEFDGRQARRGDEFGGLRAEGAGQNTVPVPILEPGRRRGIEGTEFEEGRPRAMGGHIAPDPGE